MRTRQFLITSASLLLASMTWAQTGAKPAVGQSLSVVASSAGTEILLNGGLAAWNHIAVKHVALNRAPPLYDTDEPANPEIPSLDVRAARSGGKLLMQVSWHDPTHDAVRLTGVPNT